MPTFNIYQAQDILSCKIIKKTSQPLVIILLPISHKL